MRTKEAKRRAKAAAASSSACSSSETSNTNPRPTTRSASAHAKMRAPSAATRSKILRRARSWVGRPTRAASSAPTAPKERVAVLSGYPDTLNDYVAERRVQHRALGGSFPSPSEVRRSAQGSGALTLEQMRPDREGRRSLAEPIDRG